MNRTLFYLRKMLGIKLKRPPLHEAIFVGDVEQVRSILDSGVSANITDALGLPALRLAIYRGNTNIVNLLLERGADPNVKGIQHALAWAEEHRYYKIVDALSAAGIIRDSKIKWNS